VPRQLKAEGDGNQQYPSAREGSAKVSAAEDEGAVEVVAELVEGGCQHCKVAAGRAAGSQRAAKQSGNVFDGDIGRGDRADRFEDGGEAVALVVATEVFALDGEGLAGRAGGDEVVFPLVRSPVSVGDVGIDRHAGVAFAEEVAAERVAIAEPGEVEAAELEGSVGEARANAGAEVELAERAPVSKEC